MQHVQWFLVYAIFLSASGEVLGPKSGEAGAVLGEVPLLRGGSTSFAQAGARGFCLVVFVPQKAGQLGHHHPTHDQE